MEACEEFPKGATCSFAGRNDRLVEGSKERLLL